MPKFSGSSIAQLSTCHHELQVLFNEVIKTFDCVVTEGFRNEEAQNKAFVSGNSKIKWPNGNHNRMPSLAADVYPYHPTHRVHWEDTYRMYYFAGYVLGIAQKLYEDGKMTLRVRWGGDWNMNTQVLDEKFKDLGHFELIV